MDLVRRPPLRLHLPVAPMTSGFFNAVIGSGACLGVLACTGWRCLRNRRHRLRESVKELAGELHARAMRVQTTAREALSCVQWIGGLPDVAAAVIRSELREVRSLAARANGISRAAAEVLEVSVRTGLKDRLRLNELHAEVKAYERRLAGIEEALQDRRVLLSHSRSLLARHGPHGAGAPGKSAAGVSGRHGVHGLIEEGLR
jgi:hypothetical protein